jgi:hypothetical protein
MSLHDSSSPESSEPSSPVLWLASSAPPSALSSVGSATATPVSAVSHPSSAPAPSFIGSAASVVAYTPAAESISLAASAEFNVDRGGDPHESLATPARRSSFGSRDERGGGQTQSVHVLGAKGAQSAESSSPEQWQGCKGRTNAVISAHPTRIRRSHRRCQGMLRTCGLRVQRPRKRRAGSRVRPLYGERAEAGPRPRASASEGGDT